MNMPQLYSIEMGELLVKIFEEINPCALLYDPDTWKGNVQKIGATLVTGNLPEDFLARDCQMLHCIAQLLAVNWKRVSYGNYNKFQGEVVIAGRGSCRPPHIDHVEKVISAYFRSNIKG
jgi:hypothetical protein